MSNPIRDLPTKEGEWFVVLIETVKNRVADGGSFPSVTEILADMAGRWGVSEEVMGAWRLGVGRLSDYALSPTDVGVDSLDEEEEALRASRSALLPVFQARLQARIDEVDRATAGQSRCPTSGETGESRGRLPRRLASVFGEVHLRRRWSRCKGHKKGWSEAERQLQIPEGSFTARLGESMSLLSTVTTHGTAQKLCEVLLGVSVSSHALQDVVETRAQAVIQLQDKEAQMRRPVEKDGTVRPVSRPADAVPKPPSVAYVEVDGVFPMTRELDPQRSVPAPGHRGGKGRRYVMEGKEVKNAVLYQGDDCCTEGDQRGIVLEKNYVSHLGHWRHFAALLWTEMLRQRFDQADTLILLSDGAHWIRELAEYFPREVRPILDLFHAKHRVWEVANALYGERTPKARKWAHTQCALLENGKVRTVIASLKRLRPSRINAREKVDQLVTYFTNNTDRMDYPTYRTNGWRISSGGVESANYHVTGARLKMQGMRWSPNGAAEMTRLRADLANDLWRQRTREVLAM